MLNKKIGIITQARMTSSRLPGKVLKTINNRPLLDYHIERLAWAGIPIIIATTTNTEDDSICQFAKERNLPFFRGSESNVLSRFFTVAKLHQLDVIVRVTSDCPLIDGFLIEDALKIHLSKNSDLLYTSNVIERSFPRGFDFEIFSFKRLETAFRLTTEDFQREHVTPFINQNVDSKTEFQHITTAPDRSDWRITVDTTQDFDLVEKLIVGFNCSKFNYRKVGNILDEHPELKNINNHIVQKKL